MPDSLPHPDLVAALPRLRRYARVLTGDLNRADDLVQDTLARAWEKRRLWQPGSDLRAWLFTIMHNVHVNQFAVRRRELAES
jgi:RNA polymerase sigma-70 factor (ECF subfamily)